MTWTPAKITKLCQSWGDNHTFDMIARQLGMTRSAIGGKINRLRIDRFPALIEADAKRGPRLDRMGQVAEWMANEDGRICDMARALGIPPGHALHAWKRVVKAMGAQAI